MKEIREERERNDRQHQLQGKELDDSIRRRGEQRLKLENRVQQKEAERSEGKITGEMRNKSQGNGVEETFSSGTESRVERDETDRSRNARKREKPEKPVVLEHSGNESQDNSLGSKDESLVVEPGKGDERTRGKFRGEVSLSIDVDSTDQMYSQLQPASMVKEDNGADCVLVKEQLNNGCSSVPYEILGVKISGEIVEKAAVVDSEFDRGYDLLRNRTTERLGTAVKNTYSIGEITRSQARRKACDGQPGFREFISSPAVASELGGRKDNSTPCICSEASSDNEKELQIVSFEEDLNGAKRGEMIGQGAGSAKEKDRSTPCARGETDQVEGGCKPMQFPPSPPASQCLRLGGEKADPGVAVQTAGEENQPVPEYRFTLRNGMKRCQELMVRRFEGSKGNRRNWYDKRAVKLKFKRGIGFPSIGNDPNICDFKKITRESNLKGKVRKGEILWSPDCDRAFQELKTRLTERPLLYSPNYATEFIVQTDASDSGMGVVLSQSNDAGEEHPILYLSKKFSPAEKNYSTTEKECASIVFAVKKLHYYLDGQNFTVVTDHNPLVWLKRNAGTNPRLTRWSLALQPYHFRVEHRAGRKHTNADSLSRADIK